MTIEQMLPLVGPLVGVEQVNMAAYIAALYFHFCVYVVFWLSQLKKVIMFE
jgi:hypothetical protein